jgi:hypothetical protein
LKKKKKGKKKRKKGVVCSSMEEEGGYRRGPALEELTRLVRDFVEASSSSPSVDGSKEDVVGLPPDELDCLLSGSQGEPFWEEDFGEEDEFCAYADQLELELVLLSDASCAWMAGLEKEPSKVAEFQQAIGESVRKFSFPLNLAHGKGTALGPFDNWFRALYGVVGENKRQTRADRRHFKLLVLSDFQEHDSIVVGPRTQVSVTFRKVEPKERRGAAFDSLLEQYFLESDIRALWGGHENAPPLLNPDRVANFFKEMELHHKGGNLNALQKEAFASHTFPPRVNIARRRGLLLHGPPGTNKSTVANLCLDGIRTDKGLLLLGLRKIFSGSSVELHRQYVGQTEALILKLARRTAAAPHMLGGIFFDEVDTIGQKRGISGSSEHTRAWLSLLLRILDSPDFPRLFLFGTTNRRLMLDAALVRPGRMEAHVFLPRLDPKSRWELLKAFLTDPRRQLTMLAEERKSQFQALTLNWSGALLKSAVSATQVEIGPVGSKEEKTVWSTLSKTLIAEGAKAQDLDVSKLSDLGVSDLDVVNAVFRVLAPGDFGDVKSFRGLCVVDGLANMMEGKFAKGIWRSASVPAHRDTATAFAKCLALRHLNASLLLWLSSERLEAHAADQANDSNLSMAARLMQLLDEARFTAVSGESAVVVIDLDDLVAPGVERTETRIPAVRKDTSRPVVPASVHSAETLTIHRRPMYDTLLSIARKDASYNNTKRLAIVFLVRHPLLMQRLKRDLEWYPPISAIYLATAPPGVRTLNYNKASHNFRRLAAAHDTSLRETVFLPALSEGHVFFFQLKIIHLSQSDQQPAKFKIGVERNCRAEHLFECCDEAQVHLGRRLFEGDLLGLMVDLSLPNQYMALYVGKKLLRTVEIRHKPCIKCNSTNLWGKIYIHGRSGVGNTTAVELTRPEIPLEIPDEIRFKNPAH